MSSEISSFSTHWSRYKENYFLMCGHFATDLCQGSLSAALAVLFSHGVLKDNMQISLLVLAATLISSIVQPIVGIISDRKPRPYLMALGMLVAASGMMFIGLLDNFYQMFVLIALGGVGVAIFHPEGGKMANAVSKEHKGKGMSIFSVGGNLGFAVGPAIISASTFAFGLPGIMAIGIPAIIVASFFLYRNNYYKNISIAEIKRNKSGPKFQEDYWGFAILTCMIFFRSSVLFGLTTFTPLYFMNVYHLDVGMANLNLTMIAVCSAIASLFGGILADKYGFKNVQMWAAIASVPALFLFNIMNNHVLATLMLVPSAIAIYGTLSVSMVLGQKFLCNHVGFASGVTIGLGITFGGITSPIYGYIADATGDYRTVFWTIVVAALLTAIIAIFVPDIDKIRANQLNNQA